MAESSTRPGILWKWLRRILRFLAVILALIVLVIAIAPSLLFSRTVERKLSLWASGFLGRPVVIEDLAFGWRTPLHAGRISLPPIAGEENYPLLEIRGISVPLTLAKIAMLPPYRVAVEIEKIEFNLVKTKNGETNLVNLLSRFGGPATNKPPPPGTNALPALPIDSLNINLHRIDVRYVDLQKGMAAGLEGGSVALDWPGGTQPLTGRLAGSILLNKTNFQWTLGINLSSWIDQKRKLTPDTATFTADSGGGTNAPIYLAVSMAGPSAHVTLPLALVGQMGRAMNLPQQLPDLAGALDLRLAAKHDGSFKNWNIAATLLIKDVKVTGVPAATAVEDSPGSPTNAPAKGQGFDGSLGIAGRITLNTLVALPQSSNGPSSLLKVKGELVTEINSLDLVAGKNGISLCDLTDQRRFDVSVNPAVPADLTYMDNAHTGLASFEGTMGAAIGKCSLDAKAGYAPPGNVSYDIAAAEVTGLSFASPALQLSVPPVTFSGGFAARLKDSTFEGKDLKLALGSFLEASCAPFFNWTNGDLRVTADVKLGSMSNALAMIQFKATNAVNALPQLSGGAGIAINLRGRVPKPPFSLGDALPVAGNATFNLVNMDVDMGGKLSVSGINVSAGIDLADTGRDMLAKLGCRVARVAAGGDKLPPLTNIHLEATAAIHDFDRIEFELKDFGMDSLGTSASARMNLGGLLAAIATNNPATGPLKFLHALYVDGTASLRQDLKAISGLVPGLDSGGKIGVNVEFNNSPLRSLSASAGLDLKDVRIKWTNTVEISGVNGSWHATKTFLAPGQGRKPVSSPPQRLMIDSIALRSPKLSLAMHKTAIDFQGFEQGMKISLAVPDMLGGPTQAGCILSMRGGNPEISAKATVTGLNGGALFPGLDFKNPREGDINAVVDVSIILPPDPRGTLLDHVSLRLRTMRIGKSALIRILQAMDSRQETPQLQGAIVALSIGTPLGFEFALDNSLVTMSAELLLAGAVKRRQPILDSSPLADIMGVYKLDGAVQKLDSVRSALLLLMTDDLAELEKILAHASK